MQVTEANTDGLKRQLRVVIGAGELEDKLSERLQQLKGQVRIKGFRPGKVPVAHLRKVYGRSVMAEVVERALSEATEQAISDRNERPAMQPDVKLSEDKDELEKIMSGEADLAYTLSFEVLPEFTLTDLSKLKLVKPVAEVPADEIDKSVENLRQGSVAYESEEGRKAGTDDRLTIDYVGKIDGEEFEGGSGEDMFIVIGKGGFIPGFEEGLEGATAGEDRVIKATFPDTYPVADLANKEATFDVKVKDVAAPSLPELDDAFAEKMGLESVASLRDAVTEQLRQDYERASRGQLKRAILDALNDAHKFELPPTMVDTEFEAIWKQVTEGLEQAERTFEDEGKTEESARQEYREIAERRVRLGLVLSDIGDKNELTVSEEELGRKIVEQARRYPGQEQQVYEYLTKTPQALAQLRAPLYEDKVVDFVAELADVETKEVSSEELFADDDDDETGANDGGEET